jgi:hypothetical protein
MISPKVMMELHQARHVPTQFTVPTPGEHAWSPVEQDRFWEAITRFPQGPWTAIAAYVGSKSTRQAMTHAQKLRQKLDRYRRRMQGESKPYGDLVIEMPPPELQRAPPSSPATPTGFTGIASLSLADSVAIQRVSPKTLHARLDSEVAMARAIGHQRPSFDGCIKEEAFEDDDFDEEVDFDDLDDLLSDIDCVLDHVANFSTGNGAHASSAPSSPSSPPPLVPAYPVHATVGWVDERVFLNAPHHTNFYGSSDPSAHRQQPRYLPPQQSGGWLDESDTLRL